MIMRSMWMTTMLLLTGAGVLIAGPLAPTVPQTRPADKQESGGRLDQPPAPAARKPVLTLDHPGGLEKVHDLMLRAGRQLHGGEAGKPVQNKQQRAVALLDQLIDEAQQQEKQQANNCQACGGKGCKLCQSRRSGMHGGMVQGNQTPSSPAHRSILPQGQGRIGALNPAAHARPGEQWGKMRPEERDRVLQALRQSFPARYRQLVEQYYTQLSKER